MSLIAQLDEVCPNFPKCAEAIQNVNNDNALLRALNFPDNDSTKIFDGVKAIVQAAAKDNDEKLAAAIAAAMAAEQKANKAAQKAVQKDYEKKIATSKKDYEKKIATSKKDYEKKSATSKYAGDASFADIRRFLLPLASNRIVLLADQIIHIFEGRQPKSNPLSHADLHAAWNKDPEFCNMVDLCFVKAGTLGTRGDWFLKLSNLKGSRNDVAHPSSPAEVDQESHELLKYFEKQGLPRDENVRFACRIVKNRRMILGYVHVKRDAAWK
jgi:hypothetical protein